jgi:hypothetical protein
MWSPRALEVCCYGVAWLSTLLQLGSYEESLMPCTDECRGTLSPCYIRAWQNADGHLEKWFLGLYNIVAIGTWKRWVANFGAMLNLSFCHFFKIRHKPLTVHLMYASSMTIKSPLLCIILLDKNWCSLSVNVHALKHPAHYGLTLMNSTQRLD